VGGSGTGLQAVVGLRRTRRDHRVRALAQGIGHQELKLARLVFS
jgi:hypothetical protein